jgi:hypothetical protein|tara:strand:+ start:259 stop:684 length:426 start_codon:yes stop_codon:yes gene_type:complete
MNSIGAVVRLRLKMTDFLDTIIESWVINRINEIYKINQFKLHLWYENDEVTPAQIKEFIKKYEKELHFKTTIKSSKEIERNEFVWYDIIDEKDKDVAARTRFTYIGDVVNGLNQFEETLKFCLKPKNNDTPIRKQKRNDNQ